MIKITDSNITIMVKSMDKAIEFYKSIGLSLKNRWDNHYAMMETTGVTIGIHPYEGEVKVSGNVSIGFMVDDISIPKVELDKHGIKYTYTDGKSGIYLHFSDLDGTALYFTQPKWKYE